MTVVVRKLGKIEVHASASDGQMRTAAGRGFRSDAVTETIRISVGVALIGATAIDVEDLIKKHIVPIERKKVFLQIFEFVFDFL